MRNFRCLKIILKFNYLLFIFLKRKRKSMIKKIIGHLHSKLV